LAATAFPFRFGCRLPVDFRARFGADFTVKARVLAPFDDLGM
jgi:hypothetical protein